MIIQACLDDYRLLEAVVDRCYYGGRTEGFYIRRGQESLPLTVTATHEEEKVIRYDLTSPDDLLPGEPLALVDCHGRMVPVECRWIVRSERFRREYQSDEPLGAIYEKDQTIFRVFAPTALSVTLVLKRGDQISDIRMERKNGGVHERIVPGDLARVLYRYRVARNEGLKETIDPYALSSTVNGEWSAVIDEAQIILPPVAIHLPEKPTDAVIYETNVRDFTSRILTKARPGTYEAFPETGLQENGEPAGLDAVCQLGVTHIQLQPVLDAATGDEYNADRFYNWGYDAQQFFALEGSYTEDPDDPYARMQAFARLVAEGHRHGLGIIADVVYNHVYDIEESPLNNCVPYYYFRYDGRTLSNGSFCGNDLDSVQPMTRRLIKDSLMALVRLYDVDGFRFDLMGIIDRETMRQAADLIRAAKPGALILGEGWDMPTALDPACRSTLANQAYLPDIGMFNDRFRDAIKGGTADSQMGDGGYCTGRPERAPDFVRGLLGSCGEPGALFSNAGQSVNAPETHDNATLYDKILAACPQENEETRSRRQKMVLAGTLLACGIPFLHAGIEMGGTKQGNTNSYDAGDEINGIDWKRLAGHQDLYSYTKALIGLRHQADVFRLSSPDEIRSRIHIGIEQDGTVIERADSYVVIFNPNTYSRHCTFDSSLDLILDEKGLPGGQGTAWDVPPLSVYVLKREDN